MASRSSTRWPSRTGTRSSATRKPRSKSADELVASARIGSVQVTQRQSIVLRKVIEGHVALGQPVGSKWLAEQEDMPWGPSTIRAELATLEDLGLLQHPHTSAGRVPTDHGYRRYVDELLESGSAALDRPRLDIGVSRQEIDEAMRATTEQLSQVTNLL